MVIVIIVVVIDGDIDKNCTDNDMDTVIIMIMTAFNSYGCDRYVIVTEAKSTVFVMERIILLLFL